MSGGALWDRYGGVIVSGTVKIGNAAYPYVYMADLRTGYNHMTVVINPQTTYEFGLDARGGWSLAGGKLTDLKTPVLAMRTSSYVNRLGYYKVGERTALKVAGIDPQFGDKIVVTPTGGASILVVVKPQTRLVSAIEYGSGQVNIFADYRPIQGVLYPFVTMQGKNTANLTIFQAQSTVLTPGEPPASSIARPALPTAAAPVTAKAKSPVPTSTKKP
jgi:hypothetical protein